MTRPLLIRALLCTLASLVVSAPAAAQTVAPPFAGSYSIFDLGAVPGLAANYGGLTFQVNQPNTLLIGGSANNSGGVINSVGVTRDGQGHINGFSGTSALFSTAPQIDGGLAYGPGNVLFYTGYANNVVGQIKPGSTSPDRIVTLPASTASVGGLFFVPNGFTGAGNFRLMSYNNNGYFSADLAPDGSGTYNINNVTQRTTLSGGLEGLVYVPNGSPVFTLPSVLTSDYSAGRVSAYTLDANGYPDPATRQDFITGLSGAEGALTDPSTGDFLFSTFGGGNHVFRVSGFVPVPEPTGLLAAGLGVLALASYVRRRWANRAPAEA